MAKKSALELFEHYYQALIYSLPIKDDSFLENLFKHDLLPGNNRQTLEALSTHKQRTSHFLDNIIKPGLLVGNDTYFDKLLTVMSSSDYDNAKDLAEQIKTEYDSKEKCKLVICMYIDAFTYHRFTFLSLVHLHINE